MEQKTYFACAGIFVELIINDIVGRQYTIYFLLRAFGLGRFVVYRSSSMNSIVRKGFKSVVQAFSTGNFLINVIVKLCSLPSSLSFFKCFLYKIWHQLYSIFYLHSLRSFLISLRFTKGSDLVSGLVWTPDPNFV